MISNFFANSRPSASNFKSFSRSLEQFFLTVGQNNFGNIDEHVIESADKHQQKAAHEGKKQKNGLNNNKDNSVPDGA